MKPSTSKSAAIKAPASNAAPGKSGAADPRPATQRSLQAEQVKNAILEAAIPLFARGFDSVAIKDIAAASGYKHSLVMYHFSTKEQLWELAAARLMQRFDELHRRYFEHS